MPRTHESTRELMHQSEAKRKQALQSEANVWTTNAISKKPLLLIAQDTPKCTEHPTQIRGCVLVAQMQK